MILLFLFSLFSQAYVADNEITTVKLANGSVTYPKMAALNSATSSSSGGAATITSTSFADLTNQSISLTTNGRMVVICSQPISPAGAAGGLNISRSAASAEGELRLLVDGTSAGSPVWIVTAQATGATAVNNSVSLPCYRLTPTAGAHTFALQGRVINGTSSESLVYTNLILVGYEL